ncbi:MAG: hypothetical protein V4857_14360 [Pseudomonadota bacterium]
MSLDHGLLNVPLAKRGNVDAQLDAYKVRLDVLAAAARKTARAEHAANKAAAKVALAQLVDMPDLLHAKAITLGVSRKILMDTLKSLATWEPKKLLAIHAQIMAQTAK